MQQFHMIAKEKSRKHWNILKTGRKHKKGVNCAFKTFGKQGECLINLYSSAKLLAYVQFTNIVGFHYSIYNHITITALAGSLVTFLTLVSMDSSVTHLTLVFTGSPVTHRICWISYNHWFSQTHTKPYPRVFTGSPITRKTYWISYNHQFYGFTRNLYCITPPYIFVRKGISVFKSHDLKRNIFLKFFFYYFRQPQNIYIYFPNKYNYLFSLRYCDVC